jgi:hypothetical protein
MYFALKGQISIAQGNALGWRTKEYRIALYGQLKTFHNSTTLVAPIGRCYVDVCLPRGDASG